MTKLDWDRTSVNGLEASEQSVEPWRGGLGGRCGEGFGFGGNGFEAIDPISDVVVLLVVSWGRSGSHFSADLFGKTKK